MQFECVSIGQPLLSNALLIAFIRLAPLQRAS